MAFVSGHHAGKRTFSVSRKTYARLPQIIDVPNLIEIQLGSFQWFQERGL